MGREGGMRTVSSSCDHVDLFLCTCLGDFVGRRGPVTIPAQSGVPRNKRALAAWKKLSGRRRRHMLEPQITLVICIALPRLID